MAPSHLQLNPPEMLRPLMASPSAGSANPAVSLDALWAYVQPALDHILHSPCDDYKPAALEPAYHMGIHTVVYNYFTSQSESAASYYSRQEREESNNATGLYTLLDKYFQSAVQDYFLATPSENLLLIEFYVATFERFSIGLQSIHRLLNYVNRHFVKRAQDEDRGWLRMRDLLDGNTGPIEGILSRDKLAQRLREKRIRELKDWGYQEGDSDEELARAETSAEAASSPDRVVHVNALGYRRWRLEMVEPLLSVPKVSSKSTRSKQASQSAKRPQGMKSRLARAVQELVEGTTPSVQQRKLLAQRLTSSLQTVGLRLDHPVRRRLDKFIVASCSL